MTSTNSSNIGWSIAAIALLMVGLGCNPLFIGSLFESANESYYHTWLFILVVFDVLCIASGIQLWRVRKTVTIRTVALALAILCGTLALTEIGLRIESKYFYSHKYLIMAERTRISFFRDKPGTDELFREFSGNPIIIDPFTGWRTAESHGTYLNVDADGSRRTVNHGTSGDTLLMLGGSSLWGEHVRDEYTIPSLISERLNERGTPVCVLNYGVRGFTFTQDLARLTMLLREGMRPKTVILYDGVNEISSTYHYDSVGIVGLSGELNTLLHYQRQPYLSRVANINREAIENEVMLFNVAGRISHALGLSKGRSEGTAYSEERLSKLADGIASDFAKTYAALDRLAAIYQFRFAFVLQPNIYTKKLVTEEEKTVDALEDDPGMRMLHLKSYAAIDSLHLPNVYDYARAFDSLNTTIYMDYCHTSEDGNAIIARTMAEQFFR